MVRRQRGELIRVYQLRHLHTAGEGAERTGRWFTVAARLAAGAAVLLGWLAGALLWWHPDPTGLRQALAVGGAALGCGVAWAVLLGRAVRWLRGGVIADAGSEPPPAGLVPDGWGDPEWLWNTLRIANLVLMGFPIAGLTLGLGATAAPEDVGEWVRWPVTGGALLMTALMGGIVGSLSAGLGASTEDCWTVRGAVGWLVVYGVPFLLAVPWLSGQYETWSDALVALAALWLLIAPVNKVAKELPSVSSD
ncbi:putative membrane protein [Streptomyces davaonensis JCM 4913]|uniref:Putative membrane protein n=1 Tax=Streptomyces davaonensis (strain DSM 101723 / JCM 4913 / KCC S-0913 / 768) TaxID=1214101 RepID=K4REP6_STRDJ|nr:hypothetical protein [Streptomyces davaonensis]CCK31980.1 putative membrane protein [Streptomyces davaonensis JCM 4913]